MLALQMKSGEYITIGENVVVQIFKQNGSTFRVEVKAPREVPILRGSVRERDGTERPEGLLTRRPSAPSRRRQNAESLERLARRREE